MRKIFFLYNFNIALMGFSQIGIKTSTPQAILDITGKNILDPSSKDGILIPWINNCPSINPTASQNGMLVYLTIATAAGTPFEI